MGLSRKSQPPLPSEVVIICIKLNNYSNKTVKSKKSQKAIFGIQKMR